MFMLLLAWEVLNIFSTAINDLLFQLHLYLTPTNSAIGTSREMHSAFYNMMIHRGPFQPLQFCDSVID